MMDYLDANFNSKLLINMDVKGNKLFPCKIPDQYLKTQKSHSILAYLKKAKNSVLKSVLQTLKRKILISLHH